jgi:hypothetical protein
MVEYDSSSRDVEICHLETEVHALRANVKQQITRSSDCLSQAGLDFPERMQFCWSWLTK